MARVRTCGVDTCRWLFLDTSKNHTRRWCNMKVCGNRVKARRFQARRDPT
jgi:predicted RNA-binding Zn ribbon-like protein